MSQHNKYIYIYVLCTYHFHMRRSHTMSYSYAIAMNLEGRSKGVFRLSFGSFACRGSSSSSVASGCHCAAGSGFGSDCKKALFRARESSI